MIRKLTLSAAFLGLLCVPAVADGWTLNGSSALMPQGHMMYTLDAVSGEGRIAAFSCNTVGPKVSFILQVGFGGLKLTDDGYGNKMAMGKEAPVAATWSVDGKVAGKGRWKRNNDIATADDKSAQQLMQSLAGAASQISFKAANSTSTFSAKGIASLSKMLASCRSPQP